MGKLNSSIIYVLYFYKYKFFFQLREFLKVKDKNDTCIARRCFIKYSFFFLFLDFSIKIRENRLLSSFYKLDRYILEKGEFDLKPKSLLKYFFLTSKVINIFYLVFPAESFRKSFCKELNNLVKKGFNLSYFFIQLRGRNFKFFIIDNFLIIFLGFCHYIYIPLPKEIKILFLLEKNTKICFVSFNKNILLSFIYFLKKLYKKDIYKGKGVYFYNEKVFLKVGKKKEW